MNTNQNFNLIFRELERLLAEEKSYHEDEIRQHEDRIRKIKDLDRRLCVMRLGGQPIRGDTDSSSTQRVGITDGRLDTCPAMLEEPVYALSINGKRRKATESEIRSIDRKDFAVYLDVTTGVLASCLHRKEEKVKTIEKAGVSGVEDILGVLLEYPHLNFGNVNISLYLPPRAGMTPDAFRKAMARIRNAVQGGDKDGPLLLRIN